MLRIEGDLPAGVTDRLSHLDDLPHEQLEIIHLDGDGRLLGYSEPAIGTAYGVAIPIRRIVADALRLDTRTLFLIHNHPSGDPLPSIADVVSTRRLADALHLLDIRIADHLIVAGGRCVSLRDRNQL